jgi:hypothetical protein
MVFRVAVRESLHALRVNKTRSALTSLGIVIGIGAVITLVSAGQVAHGLLEDKLESVGKDVILVRAGARTQQGMVADFAAFSNDDVAAIRREAGPLLTGVAPVQMTQRVAVTRWGRWPTAVVGSTPEMERIRRWPAGCVSRGELAVRIRDCLSRRARLGVARPGPGSPRPGIRRLATGPVRQRANRRTVLR